MTLYEITGEFIALNNMLESLVDENGEPRDMSEDEKETMKQWFDLTEADFKKKFDSICKFIKNLKLSAEQAEAERKIYADELSRLSRRAKAFEARAKSVQSLLWWCMQKLGMAKSGYKTDLFSAKEQNTQKQISTNAVYDWHDIPERFLKAPELDTTAIKQALKDGELYQKEYTGDEALDIDYSKLFFKTGADKDTALKGVSCLQGSALVIR